MKAMWQRLSAWFDALTKRERMVVFFGAIAAVALVGYQVLVYPYLTGYATATKRLAQIQQSQQELQAKVAAGEAQARQPDARLRGEIEAARKRLVQVDAQYATVHATLVQPGQMANLVASMLKSDRGLHLVSMTMLAPSPVFARPQSGASTERKPAPGGPEGADAADLFKHGLQITVRGGYADLLRYLERLERMPQKMYWNRVVLTAEEYPFSMIQLTVYTIGFGKSWLEI